jgi:hypothetical protein
LHVSFAWLLALASAAAAACELPPLAAIPDKVRDTPAVLRDVNAYRGGMVAYAACLRDELAAAGGDAAPPLQRSVLVRRNNAAVAELEAVTQLYAERVGPPENLRLAELLGGESQDCLLGTAVEKTAVVNDGAVIFFARNRQAYLNVLDEACTDLEQLGAFVVAYQAATGSAQSAAAGQTPLARRVCDHDRIFPYQEGSSRRVLSCNLGRFHPISEDQAIAILAPRPRISESSSR